MHLCEYIVHILQFLRRGQNIIHRNRTSLHIRVDTLRDCRNFFVYPFHSSLLRVQRDQSKDICTGCHTNLVVVRTGSLSIRSELVGVCPQHRWRFLCIRLHLDIRRLHINNVRMHWLFFSGIFFVNVAPLVSIYSRDSTQTLGTSLISSENWFSGRNIANMWQTPLQQCCNGVTKVCDWYGLGQFTYGY